MIDAGDFVNLKHVESEFVKARTAVFMATGTERQKIARLRRIETEYCHKLASAPHLKLEVRRRIAETLLDMSISRGRSLKTCRVRFKALLKVGFTDIEQEAHHYLIYGRAALERGHPRIADNLARRMIRDLQRSLRQRRSILGRQLLGHLERLAQQASQVP
jgi:hypothetical protein